MKKKVFIEIKDFTKEYPFCVDFSASVYGSGSPCKNEEEVRESVESCKKWIIKEGDYPIVKDLRFKATLKAFVKEEKI